LGKAFTFDTGPLSLNDISHFVFNRDQYSEVTVSAECQTRVRTSYHNFLKLLEKKLPIYGVTTGFGDSCFNSISNEKSEQLQANLISYLLCGTGTFLSAEVGRAVLLIRMNSLCRGYSGVSPDLINHMRLFLERDWLPVIPKEGSLGASGDLVPLAYVAQILQGEGQMYYQGQIRPTAEVLKEAGVEPYRLKPKEGLALVNGTSTMAGLCLVNLKEAQFLTELASAASSWLCLSMKGRTEPFGVLVNEKAKKFTGQKQAAAQIRSLLQAESHSNKPLSDIQIQENQIQEQIQDRYSLRCSPQVLGPVIETLEQISEWVELEINGVSDNPLIDDDGQLQMGGNFYGGYLGHSMDYMKICMAQIADLLDRQLMSLCDAKSNRGLPPNLVNWKGLPKEDWYLHHGLKGLHQSVSAITSEIMARATPNTIFSRSSESHNQDKVSLGMSAAVQCTQILEPLFSIASMYFICLAQALDLRGIEVQGEISKKLMKVVRSATPFVEKDQPMDRAIVNLSEQFKKWARTEQLFQAGQE
jgi:histidine ammonia-lyase